MCYLKKWYRENGGTLDGLPDIVNVTYDPINQFSQSDEELQTTNEIHHKLMGQTSQSLEEIKAIENQLHELIRAHPNNPIYYNYLAICAEEKNDLPLAMTITHNTLKKFPDYLFAKINYASILLQANEQGEAAKVLGGSSSLTEMFPNRNTFHASEVLSFHNCKMTLALQQDNVMKAMFHYTILNELDDDYVSSSDLFLVNEVGFNLKKLQIIQQYIIEKGYTEERLV